MKNGKEVSSVVFVIFGGTGDLAKRKLIPALYNLYLDGRMPQNFEVIGLGRTRLRDSDYRNRLYPDLSLFSRSGTPLEEKWMDFSSHISYLSSTIDRFESYLELNNRIEAFEKGFGERSERVFYLSVAPHFIGVVSENIKNAGLAERVDSDRIVVEKPFGQDKDSATTLNKLLSSAFEEEQIYRIDHYLGKETVQNILSFRFANNIFEPLWNASYIASVEISIAEKVGVEGRGGYFETAGSLRDMVQNHLLQILSLVAMEVPDSLDPEHLWDKKLQVLKDIRPFVFSHVTEVALRGQYTSGSIDGETVPGYREEDGVDPLSTTETYTSVNLFIDNPRWSGVPFYLRSGKRMSEKSSSITINFQRSRHFLFADGSLPQPPNKLVINLQPASDVYLSLNSKKSGADVGLKTSAMVFGLGLDYRYTPEAYETLLLDVLYAKPSLFMRADQVEKAWEVVMPVLHAWSANADDLIFYPSGGKGPFPGQLAPRNDATDF